MDKANKRSREYEYKYRLFLIFIIIFFGIFFLFSKSTWAGACDTTISSATTSQLSCADDDSLTVDSNGSITYDDQNAVLATTKNDITISNSGTIKVWETGGGLGGGGSADSAIQGQSTLNLNITNSGTIWAQDDYGIKLIQAEKVTITNEAAGTIKGTPNESGSQIAIGGTKMGNCETCADGASSSTGEGLTLHNYGTIDANSRSVYGGHASSHTSKKTKIYNYNGGMIDATSASAVKFQYAEDFELYNYSGATIQTGTGNYAIDLKGASTITIDNAGTIKPGAAYAIYCDTCSNLTLTNSGDIEATSDTLFLRDMTGTNTITNSGTIKNTSSGRAIQFNGSTGVTFENTGTVESVTQVAVDFVDSINPTLKNWGTIKTTANKSKVVDFPQTDATGTGGTVENYGTIIASTGSSGQAIRVGDGTATWDDLKIINSGTISSVGESVLVSGGSDTSGLDITTKGEGTWVGEIDMESAAVTMTLDCSISKDQDIEIEDKTNMVIVNNLCGNDTYEILDSNKNADADNSETDGYLRIYGEDLDIAQYNALYRSENVLSKLRGILSPASNDKDLFTFHNIHRRSEYTNNMVGTIGYFNSKTNNYFISYSDQRVSFGNSEYRGGENIALGMNKKFNTNHFSYYITPLIGFEDLKITDVETEGNQAVDTSLTSQFIGLDAGIGKTLTANKRNRTSFKINTTYGAQRFPGYSASFTDGELLVDDSVDQVMGVSCEIKNALGIKRNVQLYVGGKWNETLSDELEITADGENKNVSPEMQKALGHYVGIDVRAKIKGFSFDLNLEYGTAGGLTNQVASLSLTKFF